MQIQTQRLPTIKDFHLGILIFEKFREIIDKDAWQLFEKASVLVKSAIRREIWAETGDLPMLLS